MEQGVLKYRCAAANCDNKYYGPICKKKHFFRFPDQLERRKEWCKAMNLPLITTRGYLCQDHFDEKSFTDTNCSRLTRFASPVLKKTITILENKIIQPSTHFSSAAHQPLHISEDIQVPSASVNVFRTKSAKRKLDFSSHASSKHITLHDIGETRVKDLTPRERKLYKANQQQKKEIYSLKTSIKKRKDRMRNVLSSHTFLTNLENNVNPVGISYIKSIFNNSKKKKPSWTIQNKVFSLALYKKGPKCYRFLRKFLPLPSKSSLQAILKDIPLDVGINGAIFSKLSKTVSKMDDLSKKCVLLFDEMSLSEQLIYDHAKDKIVGYVDLGPRQGRRNQQANHALVFMIRGLFRNWKQPIVYFFTKDVIQTDHLIVMIKEIIGALQNVGLNVAAIICDQGCTNRSAVRQLCLNTPRGAPYFSVNSEKIFTLFDPPHLLKSTRNAFFKYNIRYKPNKVANSDHVKQCFDIDKKKRFQGLRKIREAYFSVNNRLKMKVAVAARIFSNTMAASIESLIGTEPGKLPSEAINTASFIHDIDCLFDSFNGTTIQPNKGKPYRRCLSKKSRHWLLWNRMLPEISNWIFESKPTQSKDNKNIESKGKTQTTKKEMPFKAGWIRTIQATKELFEMLSQQGIKFLKTRNLNQDPLENTFAGIRSYGAANTNPNCLQFIAALKTSLLNNLIVPISNGQNCEKDDATVLDNLQSFVLEKPITTSDDAVIQNELENCSFQVNVNLEADLYDAQTATYVGGWLVKKLKIDCEVCRRDFFSEHVELHHTFTMFKEVDEKKRLKYVTIDVAVTLTYIHDYVIEILKHYGHICDIRKKIIAVLKSKLNFHWMTCTKHRLEVIRDFLDIAISLVIRKYCDDLYRSHQNKYKFDSNKMDKIKHL